MAKQKLSDGTVNFLRKTAVILGCVFLLVAVLADPLGLSAGQGLSRNQISFGIAGLVLILAGATGRVFYGIYRSFAVLLLNLIVLVIVIEFLSLALVKIFPSDNLRRRTDHLAQGSDAAAEQRVTISSYVPWVIWRSNPSQDGDPATIDPAGRRVTTGNAQDPDAYSVFTLGGSAMWGANVTDSATIASFLASDLTEALRRPVHVSNLAQNAHVSTQEVIELMLELRAGNIPDIVIFYDGFNEVWTSYQFGSAGLHDSYQAISSRIEGRDEGFTGSSPLQSLLRSSNTWLLVSVLRDRLGLNRSPGLESLVNYATMGVDQDSLASQVMRVYFENSSLVEHLAEAYGFECLFVWQPVLWCGDKHLTDFEMSIRDGDFESYPAGGDQALHGLLIASYSSFRQSRPDTVRYLSMHDFFDDSEEQIYTDFTGVHVTQEANRLIAAALAERLLQLDPDLAPIL